jgi:hypothetical protein
MKRALFERVCAQIGMPEQLLFPRNDCTQGTWEEEPCQKACDGLFDACHMKCGGHKKEKSKRNTCFIIFCIAFSNRRNAKFGKRLHFPKFWLRQVHFQAERRCKKNTKKRLMELHKVAPPIHFFQGPELHKVAQSCTLQFSPSLASIEQIK